MDDVGPGTPSTYGGEIQTPTLDRVARMAHDLAGAMPEKLAQMRDRVPAARSLHFTSNACFDIGSDLESPVSLDYFDQAPFPFSGTIGTTKIAYTKK